MSDTRRAVRAAIGITFRSAGEHATASRDGRLGRSSKPMDCGQRNPPVRDGVANLTSRIAGVAGMALCCAALSSAVTAGTVPRGAPSPVLGSVEFQIAVPVRAQRKQRVRAIGLARPQYISASTESLAILVDGANPHNVNLTPGSPGCKAEVFGTVCQLFLKATSTTHVFTVKTFDAPNSSGNLLSLNTTGPIAVTATGTTYVPLVLQGVVANLILSVTIPYPDSGSAAAIPLAAVAEDADRNIIVGSSLFANPLVLTTTDPANGVPSKSVLASPADEQGLTVAYSGAQTPAISISAAAARLSGTVVPAVITPTPPTTSKLYVVEAPGDVKVFRTANLGLPPSVIDVAPPDGLFGLAVDPSAHRLFLPRFTTYISTVLPDGDFGVYDTSNLDFLGNAVFGESTDAGWLGPAAFDSATSMLYVATTQYADNETVIYATNATNFQAVSAFVVPFVTIQGIAVDRVAGVLYATVGGFSPTVAVYSLAPGHPALGEISGQTSPQGVAVDSQAGNVYVADDFYGSAPAGVVRVYSRASRRLLSTITGLQNPRGVAVDPLAGKLYVADYGGYVPGTGQTPPGIKVYSTANGYPLVTTISNVSGVGQIAVVP